MNRREWLMLSAILFVVAGSVHAADKADPNGKWKWSVMFNDRQFDIKLKLKYADSKLSGDMSVDGRPEVKIEDASFKDDEVAFSVTRERNGEKFVTKYKGKIEGDTIKGTFETERDGKTRSREWEAKREKA